MRAVTFQSPHEVRLEDTRSLDEALARVRGALATRTGIWLLGRGWRSGDWQPQVEPTKQLLDEHMSGATSHHTRLWALLMLELWFRMWVDQPAEAALARPAA